MTTGQRIKMARKKVGMSQAQLAEKLGIPFQSISQWERDTRNPKQETLEKIADALGISVSELRDKPENQYVQCVMQTLDGQEVIVNVPSVYLSPKPAQEQRASEYTETLNPVENMCMGSQVEKRKVDTEHEQGGSLMIGERIKQAREKKGLTPRELGEKCGITEEEVVQYELGRRNLPAKVLRPLSTALDILVTDLIILSPEERKKTDSGYLALQTLEDMKQQEIEEARQAGKQLSKNCLSTWDAAIYKVTQKMQEIIDGAIERAQKNNW